MLIQKVVIGVFFIYFSEIDSNDVNQEDTMNIVYYVQIQYRNTYQTNQTMQSLYMWIYNLILIVTRNIIIIK